MAAVARMFAACAFSAVLAGSPSATAQYPGPPPARPPGYGQPPPRPPGYGQPPGPGYGQPPGYPPRPQKRPTSSGLELGFLYGVGVAFGVGTGIWIDAEAEIEDPGLLLIPPLVFGAVAPLGVFLVDRFAFRNGMPEGLPSALATGMIIGAGEGLGIAGVQWSVSDAADEWGFRGLARAEIIGSTLGGAAGAGLYYLIKPVIETNVLIASSSFWGTAIGSFFGGGASKAFASWGDTNDSVAVGGLVGFNVAVAGAVGASLLWTPSWNNLAWMWGGFGIGTVASLPVYIFYAGSDEHDPRRGLIFQGVAGTVGLALGAIFSEPRRKGRYALRTASEQRAEVDDSPVQFWGAGLTPTEGGGMGVQIQGALW